MTASAGRRRSARERGAPALLALWFVGLSFVAGCDRDAPDTADAVPPPVEPPPASVDSAAVAATDFMSQFTESGFASFADAAGSDGVQVAVSPTAIAFGNLDGDPAGEAAVVTSTSAGGTGVFVDLAVVDQQGGRPVNTATVFLGDRIRVHSLKIEDGRIVLDATMHTPADPSCCPSLRAVRRFAFEGRDLVEIDRPSDLMDYSPPMGEPLE
ncbi:MAG: hypothetical protein ACR2GQ_04185 [Gemmatimonadota bacterium]